jgi:hypothetical protein
MFTIYPSTMLIFLYRFPRNNMTKQTLYLLMWIGMWLAFELVMVLTGLCVYHHGWTYGSSIVFACIMVPMLALHYKHPMWASILSVPITVFFLLWFHVPVLSGK